MTDEIKETKLAQATFITFNNNLPGSPWRNPEEVDKLEARDLTKSYREVIKDCRFFYRRDPIASTVINKLVDIAINGITFDKRNLSANEERIIEGLVESFEDFAERCAVEYLVSGLLIPEVSYATVDSRELKRLGIKKRDSLIWPVSMWIRDPETIKIKETIIADMPSYFVEIPSEIIDFVKNKGIYPDGTKDIELYKKLKILYPKFIQQILNGDTEVLLENPLVIRRRYLTNSPYPLPYLYPAIESLKHKRNLRRMDYSIAARVISAIQLIRMGDKDFPITEADETQFEELKKQMFWRNSGNRDIERIFQLFGNHTLQIDWVFPPTEALLDGAKYSEVNKDIFYALGFPRVLVTGETERSGTSDPELALLSPVRTMENIRKKILKVLNEIIFELFDKNNLRGETQVNFKPLNMHDFRTLVEGISKLYDAGNLSRTSYADAFGYNLEEELVMRKAENSLMEDLELDEFAPVPHSNEPDVPGNQDNQTQPEEDDQEVE